MKSKKIYYSLVSLYLFSCVFFLVDGLITHQYLMALMSFGASFLVLVMPIVFRLLKLEPNYWYYSLFIIFVFFAAIVGSANKFYNKFWWYDLVIHHLSGYVTSYLFYLFLQKRVKTTFNIKLLLMNLGNISVATLWELYEFSLLVFFNYDAIRNKSGVYDTMSDILVCLIAGLVMTLILYFKYRTKKDTCE